MVRVRSDLCPSTVGRPVFIPLVQDRCSQNDVRNEASIVAAVSNGCGGLGVSTHPQSRGLTMTVPPRSRQSLLHSVNVPTQCYSQDCSFEACWVFALTLGTDQITDFLSGFLQILH